MDMKKVSRRKLLYALGTAGVVSGVSAVIGNHSLRSIGGIDEMTAKTAHGSANKIHPVNTLNELLPLSPNDASVYAVLNRNTLGDNGFAFYEFDDASTLDDDNVFVIEPNDGDGRFLRKPGIVDAATTIKVGAGGRFATLGEALQFLTGYRPANGCMVTVELETGFVLAEQILMEGVDLRHVMITSVDAVVSVARSSITTVWRGIRPTFGFAKSFGPIISAQFEMDSSGSALNQYGIVLRTSQLRFEHGSGFRNAPERNVEASWGSILDARYGDFSGAGDIGIRISNGSYAYIRTCKANNCATGVAVSNAIADFTDGEATGCLYSGLGANGGGIVMVNNATITGNVTSGSVKHGDIIIDYSSKIYGSSVTVGGGGSYGIYCKTGEADLKELVINNPSTAGIYAINGGVVRASLAQIIGGTQSVFCVDSEVHIPGATLTEPTTGQSIYCSGGVVQAPSCTITATTGTGANSNIAGNDGAVVNVSKSTILNSNQPLFRFLRGSELKAANVVATGCKMASGSVMARFDASKVVAPNSNFSGRLSGAGFTGNVGSDLVLTSTDIRNAGGTESANDVQVFDGSIARLHQSNAGTNVAINTISALGIVFDNP